MRPQPTTADPDDVELPEIDEPASPGGAFLRAVLVPGWGHASIGSYTRGGFYFLAETATVWMMLRTNERLDGARDILGLRRAAVEERLLADPEVDPADVPELVDSDEGVTEARSLVEARDQQFEDWTALGVFLLFLSGADAFVSAHLADFPEPVQVGVRPVGPERVEVGVSLPVGGPRRR